MGRFARAFGFFSAVLPTVSAGQLATCPEDLDAIFQPSPEYPSAEEATDYFGRSTRYLHVFVEGSVVVRLTVSASGNVDEVKVIDSTYRLVGRDRDAYEDGYFDEFHPTNVMRAVKRWKFAPVDYSCQMTRVFSWKMED